ncbi:MAG: sigma 54-interacting transcriptional regulator [Deltaproteobacteria bacterium]|nr:sigma 54-interacting transcriptional regulator [Deltaproteobacteria bacterium]
MTQSPLKVEDLRKILDINQKLLNTFQLERFFNQLVDEAIQLIGAERGFLILLQEGGKIVRTSRNLDREDLKKSAQKFSNTIVDHTLSKGEIILTTDAGTEPSLKSAASVHGMKLKSVISMPMQLGHQIIGVLYLDNRLTRGAFGERERELIFLLANQAVLALNLNRLLDENKARERELKQQNQYIERLNHELQKQMSSQANELRSVKDLLEVESVGNRQKYKYENIVGNSPLMKDVFKVMDRIMDSDVTVYIHGESGTGKELIARALHYNGPRKEKPFVTVNCSAFSETLLESELFGHMRGSFTGAEQSKKGLFEYADGGTIFLDEIGDMSVTMQAKLLRVLQEGEIRPVGSNQVVKVNVRIISASNKDLQELIKKGEFRKDLFYRLNVVRISLPPLRERREDIPALVRHFMKSNRMAIPESLVFIDDEALNIFVDYDWPGNIRELENEVNRSLLLGKGKVLSTTISPTLRDRSSPLSKELEDWNLSKKIEGMERVMIERALRYTKGNKVEAAALLGISRGNFYQKIYQYGIETQGLSLTPEVIKEALKEAGGNKAMAARKLGIGRKTLYNYLERMKIE